LGVLASRLSDATQAELFARLADEGHAGLQPRHGSVLPWMDEDGIRATELARLSGRHKQVVGRLVDELEELGYVARRADPADRRAKLVVPTDQGLEALRVADRVIAEIEERYSDRIGRRPYADFRQAMRAMLEAPSGGS
jgi:DNA-binding MarR family transcriptional regulator